MPRAFSMEAMTANDLRNVLICVPVSLLIGSVLGVVHQLSASLLTGAGATSGAARNDAIDAAKKRILNDSPVENSKPP
jgi:hypothetical protein